MSHPHDLPPLASLFAFRQAAKSLSFKQAAADLGLTPSAVSHRIRTLEQALGQPLFHRHTRSLSFTQAGSDYQQAVEALFSGLEQATADLRQSTTGKPLRISVLPLFASAILIPRLPGFKEKHPGIQLEIDTKSTLADLPGEEADIGIRNMVIPPSGRGVTKLLDTKTILLCAPEIAEDLHRLSDLRRHTLIHCAPRPNGWRDWLTLQGFPDLQGTGDLWVDTIPAGLEAANLGQGVALTMSPIAQLTLAGSRLVEPFPTNGEGGTSYYLVHRAEDAFDSRVSAFRDWMVREMADIKRLKSAQVREITAVINAAE